ncbi:MAG TPA: hypothetical protein VJM08_18850 [Anaerolineales bacterium]|nr:hypothetical protein [Anaerolineales bacterium]
MQKWEYLTIIIDGNYRDDPIVYSANGKEFIPKIPFNDYLPILGEEGWELVVARGDAYYFKRPKADYP